jgi:acetate kinase
LRTILTLNVGSSSVKVDRFEVASDGAVPSRLDRWDGRSVADVLDQVGAAGGAAAVDAVGHRVTHGGERSAPAVVDDVLLAELDALAPLAPLHVPANVAGIRAARDRWPGVAHVACFDTAFHATLAEPARRYALPVTPATAAIRRYGFHGLSYEHVARVLPGVLGERPRRRVVAAHLGSGASLCALLDGRSVATTMGFTPLDGVPMATRSGAVDPGALLYLLRQGMTVDELEELLWHRAGLLGVSGSTGSARDLLASGSEEAAAAIELFTWRVRESAGALAADLGGLDALVFTGGIGEHAGAIRARVAEGLAFLGVALDPARNGRDDVDIGLPGSPTATLVLPADEAEVIARHTADLAWA